MSKATLPRFSPGPGAWPRRGRVLARLFSILALLGLPEGGASARPEIGDATHSQQIEPEFAAKPTGMDESAWQGLRQAVSKAIGEQGTLIAVDGAASDSFGFAVSIHADTAVVGVPFADIGGTNAQGAAYVFVRSGGLWYQQAKLIASDGAATDQFGTAVAVYGDTAVVGAPKDDIASDIDQGSAYVYRRVGGQWSFEAKIVEALGAAGDHFGVSVALAGDSALIGVPYDDYAQVFEIDMGSAQVWVRGTGGWTRQARLVATPAFPAAPGANLGWSVSLSGDTALVGAWRDSIGSTANEQGSAYVFVRSGTTWSTQQKLELDASLVSAAAQFGTAVAVYGDSALVGAPRDDRGLNLLQGSAFWFTRTAGAWSYRAKLAAADGQATDQFGSAVALTADVALVGAPTVDVGANTNQGAVYAYRFADGGWSGPQRLLAAAGAIGDRLGSAVAVYGGTIMAGAPEDSVGTNLMQGSALVLNIGDAAQGDEFGYSLALSGDTLAVGVDHDQVGENARQGSVYIYQRESTGWSLQARLVAADGAAEDLFGASVALDGETLVVGAFQDDIGASLDQGSAYVFARAASHWRQIGKLTAADGAAGDRMGWRVQIANGRIYVAAHTDDVGGNVDQGSVYVYTGSGTAWTPEAKLDAGDGAAGDTLGVSLAAGPTTLLAGASGADVAGAANQGAAYIFERGPGGWSPATKLTAADGAAVDVFGAAVALAGDTALIGAPGDDVGTNPDQGSAYTYLRSGVAWSPGQVLRATDGMPGDNFGNAVALSTDFALVAAWEDDFAPGSGQGSAYAYARSGSAWSPRGQLIAYDQSSFDHFGQSLALHGNTAACGGVLDDIGLIPNAIVDAGSAYVFDLDAGAWSIDSKVTANGVAAVRLLRDGFE